MDTSTPSSAGMSEAEAAVQLLGTDPWMRFDMWAGRAWEASQRAIDMAVSIGTPVSTEDLDPRVITMFHAASVAKDFADMVNPLEAVSSDDFMNDIATARLPEMSINIITDTDDTD